MAKQSPRIYVYKITFDEVDHYYYGLKKEKYYGQYYMGSPVTHKDFWELYTPRKEYIKFFEYSDKGHKQAEEFEQDLIRPVYKNDPLCLNENCGGIITSKECSKSGKLMYELRLGVHGLSKEQLSENGRRGGQKAFKLGVGVYGRSKEQWSKDSQKGGRRGGQKAFELKVGIHGRSKDQMTTDSRKGGKSAYEKGVGIHGLSNEKRIENARAGGKVSGKLNYERGIGLYGRSKEQRIEDSRRGGITQGNRHKENKTGVFSRSKDQMIEDGKKGYELTLANLTKEERSEAGKKGGPIGGKASAAQRWQCTITGHVSTAAGLANYQRARGIDTSNRIRIQ